MSATITTRSGCRVTVERPGPDDVSLRMESRGGARFRLDLSLAEARAIAAALAPDLLRAIAEAVNESCEGTRGSVSDKSLDAIIDRATKEEP